jgi:SOS response regulatory protein OraA/RecX
MLATRACSYQEIERKNKLKEEQRTAQVQAKVIDRLQSGGSVDDRLRTIGSKIISRRPSGEQICVVCE